jgi:hypothetical protein
MKRPTLWSTFTTLQKRNIAIYSIGIMSYKFALECECRQRKGTGEQELPWMNIFRTLPPLPD